MHNSARPADGVEDIVFRRWGSVSFQALMAAIPRLRVFASPNGIRISGMLVYMLHVKLVGFASITWNLNNLQVDLDIVEQLRLM